MSGLFVHDRPPWIETCTGTGYVCSQAPARPRVSSGVTAYCEADALGIIKHVVFPGSAMPDVGEIRADVDVRDLDQGHVIPNMAPPNWRGIWYPKGFDTDIRGGTLSGYERAYRRCAQAPYDL